MPKRVKNDGFIYTYFYENKVTVSYGELDEKLQSYHDVVATRYSVKLGVLYIFQRVGPNSYEWCEVNTIVLRRS